MKKKRNLKWQLQFSVFALPIDLPSNTRATKPSTEPNPHHSFTETAMSIPCWFLFGCMKRPCSYPAAEILQLQPYSSAAAVEEDNTLPANVIKFVSLTKTTKLETTQARRVKIKETTSALFIYTAEMSWRKVLHPKLLSGQQYTAVSLLGSCVET